jgi:uncharacterized protein
MTVELTPASKLTISIGGDERWHHHPLYQQVLTVLRAEGVAGATVTRGLMSFGVCRAIHTSLNEITMENLPIIIEVIDERPKLERAASLIAEMLGEHGLVQIHPTTLISGTRAAEERTGG